MARKDFFERQDEARRQTALLAVGFLIALVGVVAAVNVVAWVVLSYGLEEIRPYSLGEWATSTAAAWTAGITAAIIIGGSIHRSAQLAYGGGGRVATLMGGRIVDPDTKDPNERKLVNVVEEISIASGTPPPDIYVLDHEQGINAFAAGTVPANSIVAFTAGAVEKLDRNELQGVVAHEFSHIANGDTRINIRLLALLAGVTIIGEIGASAWRGLFMGGGLRGSSRTHDRGGGAGGSPQAMIFILGAGLALIVIGWIGVFIGRLIKAGISRQREFLADAAAVQFTRDPSGIAGALLKIADQRNGGMLRASHAEEVSHMGFSRTVGQGLSGLTATHPPLEERLRAINPQYVLLYRQQQRVRKREKRREKRQRERSQQSASAGGAAHDHAALGTLGDVIPDAIDGALPDDIASFLSIAAIGALAGNPGATRLDAARTLLAEIPPKVYDALHRPETARRLIWALLLTEPERTEHLPAAEGRATLELRTSLEAAWGDGSGDLQARVRLPLVELALPALRKFDPEGRRTLLGHLDALIRADGRLAVHEYALRTVLVHHLYDREPGAIGKDDLNTTGDEVRCALSVLCLAIQGDDQTRQQAWQTAMEALGKTSGDGPLPRASCSLREFSAALEKLSDLQPSARRDFLAACIACITCDGQITPTEAELLRAIAAVLDTPIPPLAEP